VILQDFKISFYVNSHVDKLFRKWKRVGKFVIVGVIVQRDDERETAVKGNDNGWWIEWWTEWPRLRWPFYSSGVGVRWSGVGGRRRWCKFNASVLAWEESRRDEALPEDEAEVAISSWLNGKETWHGTTVWRCQTEERRYRGGEREETTPVGLTWILAGSKNEENSLDRFICYKWIVKI
jgi:hypothetical protein